MQWSYPWIWNFNAAKISKMEFTDTIDPGATKTIGWETTWWELALGVLKIKISGSDLEIVENSLDIDGIKLPNAGGVTEIDVPSVFGSSVPIVPIASGKIKIDIKNNGTSSQTAKLEIWVAILM